jgi:hypothetical protein
MHTNLYIISSNEIDYIKYYFVSKSAAQEKLIKMHKETPDFKHMGFSITEYVLNEQTNEFVRTNLDISLEKIFGEPYKFIETKN